MCTLIASTAIIAALLSFSSHAYAADDNWYVGEGAKQDMYVTYNIQDLDTNNGRAFDMTIYFQKQDDSGDWTAPVTVVDQGNVFNGTLKLGGLDLSVLGSGSDIPKELMPYINAYKDSLQWLSAYVPKPGQSLTSASWGKIASIGGPEIKPSGTEKVTVKGGTFDTTKIIYHKAVDNTIWVANEFPFPVKAQTYADVTTGNPPIQYAFELTATGNGKPPAPASMIEIPKPPLEQRTERGTYFVDLDWSPADIQPGKEISFTISFFDNNHNPVQDVSYDFKVTDSHGNVLKDLKNKFAPTTDTQTVTFTDSNSGPATIDININAVGSKDQGAFVESVQFGIVAAPEFPAGIVFIGTAALIGVVFVVTRFMRGGFTKLSDT
ncbi:MAG TPA: hypothetical protein VGJ42_02510 [Nitrososphaera sp.]